MKHKIFVGTVILIATSFPSITTEAGIFGEGLGGAFRGAITEYQKSKGLLKTGELSQALLTHMLRNGG